MVLIGKLGVIEKNDITDIELIRYVEVFIINVCKRKSDAKISSTTSCIAVTIWLSPLLASR